MTVPHAVDEPRTTFPQPHMRTDVAIVGYGPVGMVLATLLAQEGLKVIALEKHPRRYHLSRAGHLYGETMRIFQRLGVALEIELLAQTGLTYEFLSADLKALQRIKTGEDGSAWKKDYLCSSVDIETIVDSSARELGVQVLKGMTVDSFQDHGKYATITFHPTADSMAEISTIEAAIVIGADGANSFIREVIGSNRLDQGFAPWDNLVVDFEHNDLDRDFPKLKQNYQILDIKRPQLAGRWGGRGRSRFEFARIDGESRKDFLEENTVWSLLSKWEITSKDAKLIRKAILVGDSAHTMPPFMGQGMCSGLRDAMNLSWKLAAVIMDEADDKLLNTYQLERGPHVKAFIQMSIQVGKTVLLTNPNKAKRRDKLLKSGDLNSAPSFPRLDGGIIRQKPDATNTEGRPSLQGRVALGRRVDRLDEFLKPGWKLISRHVVPREIFEARQQELIDALELQVAHVSRGAQINSQSFYDIDGSYDSWFKRMRKKAFLQRPDNYVFGTAESIQDIPTLIDELGYALARNGWRKISY